MEIAPAAFLEKSTFSIGVFGGHHAWQVFSAFGASVTSVAPSSAEPVDAAHYLEADFGAKMLGQVQAALAGDYEHLDVLIFDRASAKLYLYLKELYRRGLGSRIPPLHLFDIVASSEPQHENYRMDQVSRLVKRLERVSNRSFSQEGLEAAVAAENRTRASLRQVIELRESGELPGSVAFPVISERWGNTSAEYSAKLDRLIGSASSLSANKPRLMLVPAESSIGLWLYELIEEEGGVVAMEDSWRGSRLVPPASTELGSTLTAVADDLVRYPATDDVFPTEARVAWYRERVASGEIDGIVFHVPLTDLKLGWDLPYRLEIAAAAGVPVFVTHAEPGTDGAGLDETRAGIRKLLDTTGSKR